MPIPAEFCSVLCLHGSREWHLPYSLLLVFGLPSCPEEPGFSSLSLDIRATAVQTAHSWVQWCSVVGFCVLQLIYFFVKLGHSEKPHWVFLCTKEVKDNSGFSSCLLPFGFQDIETPWQRVPWANLGWQNAQTPGQTCTPESCFSPQALVCPTFTFTKQF